MQQQLAYKLMCVSRVVRNDSLERNMQMQRENEIAKQ